MIPGVTITPAEPDERTAALKLAFGHLDPETRLARIAGGLELVDRGEMDPDGILVARVEDRLVGAMVAAPVPGAGAAVWPPQVNMPPAINRGLTEDAVADELVRRAAAWLRGRGVKLAQALLAMEEADLAAPLVRGGFRRATALWYLRHDLNDIPAMHHCEGPQIDFATYQEVGAERFGDVLGRTYEGTLDCPEISEARSPSEALAGHQAGEFDPQLWWLAEVGGSPVGLLLVNPALDGDGWDIAYVGVVPECRRQGFGRELVLKALLEAEAAGEPSVTLAVDARNRPARELYRRLGFEPRESRDVLLAVWR
jgi:ribosomal protein S18 acetylase RimI-like enzyme